MAEFNYVDPPLWSPDGEWLAFRVQDGEGKDEIYVVRRDGTELTNLSASENLPADGQPYVLNGWISDNVILRGRNDRVYLMRVSDDRVQTSVRYAMGEIGFCSFARWIFSCLCSYDD